MDAEISRSISSAVWCTHMHVPACSIDQANLFYFHPSIPIIYDSLPQPVNIISVARSLTEDHRRALPKNFEAT